MNFDELENFELIAAVLEVPIQDVKEWSDGSFTIGYSDRFEYIITDELKDCYYQFIGKYGDRYIYKN